MRAILVILLITITCQLIAAKSKYYDGAVQPYNFKYKDQRDSARKEQKDTNGIVTGEFGYFTADGVYRKTTFTTDDEGNYKIIAFENIYPWSTDFDFAAIAARTTPEPKVRSPFGGVSHRAGKSLGDKFRNSIAQSNDDEAVNRAVQLNENQSTIELEPVKRTASSVDNQGASAPVVDQLPGLAGGPLYKFNYTLGFHGHYEQGDLEGNKEGGYNFVDRKGVNHIVRYAADHAGYHYNIESEQASDEDTPHEETEKQFGAKGVEFKWFSDDKSQ